MKLDETDRMLIAILRKNARTPVVTLARDLKVSRATVQNRMKRLERDGVIVRYTVTLKPDAEQSPVRALMSIATETKKEGQVIRALSGYPAIAAVHHTTGRWDLIAEMRTESLASFNQVVGQVRLIDGVTNTESNLLLDSHANAAASR
ncbi:MAG: Lrp/AsnC family transcriptional regulator [Gammaproteobacteria bacterium]